ncbi:uncharacterized protein LOC108252800 [Diaphorina citri]|uniref:Uncharacterized protein LOC108252800 n=1 Tax=Diaphorina citri TaxID=121845 RepID=A0A1S4EFZ6_DIACI|nr:uncharacterized protein LOC108252800 [Diaphorina citri]KAI5703289.1 hypothetical protein M8J75_009993 [Diaphorina citri]KAI5733855.1 hypothetical protein M8J76_016896 [Diaphorina citri]KAI5738606.1 hypothetical protein M8J77_009065 [Diaphorina citri]
MSLGRASRLLPLMENVIVPHRNYRHVVSGPPLRKTSTTEIIVHGAVMSVMALSIPAWVLYHLKEYQGRA